MAGKKTLDGIMLNKIVKAAKLVGASTRQGKKHYLLEYSGYRPCPVEGSTHARKMVVPWLQKVTGYDAATIYSAITRGKW